MAKNRAQVDTPAAEPTPVVAEAPQPNYTLVYRREHPQNRCTFGIAGISGVAVFDNNFFVGGKAPATITVDVELVQPKADGKIAKAEAAAARLVDKANKAQARIEAAAAKATERQAKADAALKAAQEKVAAATAAKVQPEVATV